MPAHPLRPLTPPIRDPLQAGLPPGKTLKACVAVTDDGELYAFADSPNIVPPLDMNSGVVTPAYSIRYQTPNPTCWEYICTRYGCFWIPVPC